ncbi:hypothetical protein BV22DRAFT_1081682 [Leucogyrophana mollusca]|uniref:Uncharacterized protein n=1 Tax=Leucogyrophana mollusca TaxID=85980 RepID=A0ACB8BUF9_9AGAM|nr:hypothetical protein BV22DRAFT_1081682 [Leucogyrophana mollusca]
MSAVRRNDRRTTRSALASPYARPAKPKPTSNPPQKKKSLWSFTGLLNYLNPLRFGGNGGSDRREHRDRSDSPSSDDDAQDHSDRDDAAAPSVYQAQRILLQGNTEPELALPPDHELVVGRFQNTANPQGESHNHAPRTPARPSLPFPLNTPSPQNATAPHTPQSASLARNLEPVTRFLAEKAGQPLNEFEAAGIVDYIQKNVHGADKPEPFRFSSSTPSRDPSPNYGFGSPGSSEQQANGVSAQTPRKTLSRNPNGVYRWQGAGSARPRNRYQSPGFGQRPQYSRIKISPPPTPQTDTKRRRVGEEAESSTSQKATVSSPSKPHAASNSSQTPAQPAAEPAVNGKNAIPPPATPKPNGVSTPRFRTPGLPVKPTAPAVPSPLRQAWKQSDSPPQPMTIPPRPTKAANFMTELIKEVTPPKRADVSNPYQTASPVKPPQKKPVAKKPRATRRDKEKEKEKEPEMTAQAIIEATVPKGSKRSRPPAEMEKSFHSAPGLDAPKNPNSLPADLPSINGVTESSRVDRPSKVEKPAEEDESPTKKRKTTQNALSARSPPRPVQVEEIDDDDMPMNGYTRPSEIIEPSDESARFSSRRSAVTPPPPAPVPKPPAFGVKSSAPREPSKLRYSVQLDKAELPPVEPPAPSSPRPAPAALPINTASQLVQKKPVSNPKDDALAMDVDLLPKYTFALPQQPSYPAGSSHVYARKQAATMPPSSLPTFTFTNSKPSSTTNGFNWTAAGVKAPTASSGGTWTCGTCMLTNSDEAKEKCTVCEAPRPGAAPASAKPSGMAAPGEQLGQKPKPAPAPVQAFNWSAAGIKQPSKLGGESWTCSTCMLSNPASATDKCTVCDTPR